MVRGGRLGGVRFRRQHAVGHYIVDFYCAQARLVVEVDGAIHASSAEQDAARDDYIRNLGLKVMRFTNDEVLSQPDVVRQTLLDALSQPPSPYETSPMA